MRMHYNQKTSLLALLPAGDTADDTAAACSAAMTRPADYFRAARYDPHADIFQRLSRAQVSGAVPTGSIEAIYRERTGTWRYKSLCPYCGDTHMHGGGSGPIPTFGARDTDCAQGRGYAPVAVAAEVSA